MACRIDSERLQGTTTQLCMDDCNLWCPP